MLIPSRAVEEKSWHDDPPEPVAEEKPQFQLVDEPIGPLEPAPVQPVNPFEQITITRFPPVSAVNGHVGQRAVCPFCAELVNVNAIKCKHCGEIIDDALRAREKRRGVGTPVSTWLGISSAIGGVVGLLFLVLPCFWFLALPVSGLAAALGAVGLIFAIRKKDNPILPIIATIGCAALLLLSCGLTLDTHMKLKQLSDDLNQAFPDPARRK